MGSAEPRVKVTLLGTGTSHGIPMIGCTCPVCTSPDPHDKRTRVSAYVEISGVRILIDTAPELRLQCLANGIDALDAVLFTHHHADHVTGLDDLRRFNWLMKGPVPCYGTERTLSRLRDMFSYAFRTADDSPHSRPQLELHTISTEGFSIGPAHIIPIPLMHGPMPVLGFRFGGFAYCTDCSHISAQSLRLLEGLDVLVLDGLRRTPHPTHFNLEQAVEVARRIEPRQTYFTHIAHELGHAATNAELPPGMALSHDGQSFTVPLPEGAFDPSVSCPEGGRDS